MEAEDLAVRLMPLFGSPRRVDVIRAVARLAPAFAESLVSWTARTPAGRPAPVSRLAVRRVHWTVLAVILREWIALWPTLDQPAADDDTLDVDAVLAEVPMLALVEDKDGQPDMLPIAAEAR